MRDVIKLEESASHSAIDAALQSQAPVILESPEFNGATINGFLIAGDARALLMQVTGRPAIDLARVIDICCEGQIYGERRFCFSTKVASLPRWGETQALSFERPEQLVVMERRRFRRAKLAPSTKVTVSWIKSGVAHSYQASLLNVSADGIACKVDDAVAVNMEKSMRVNTSFELPGTERIELAGLITNKMPGAEGCSLLGLQFIRGEHDAAKIASLRTALGMERGADAEPALNA